jgi:hypothetical protein
MRANLVDEYVLLIHPLVLGSGRRLFPDGGPFAALRLVDTKPTTTGVLVDTKPTTTGVLVATKPAGRTDAEDDHLGPDGHRCWPASRGLGARRRNRMAAATIALARAGDLQQARARLEAAERIAGMRQVGHGSPPSGRRAGCSAGPKVTTRRQPRCPRRPLNTSPGRDAPSMRPGAEPRP